MKSIPSSVRLLLCMAAASVISSLGIPRVAAQSCLDFTVITTRGVTNKTTTGYAPYLPNTNSPKIFFHLTMTNYAYAAWHDYYPTNAEPREWYGTNKMQIVTTHTPTNGQIGGSGSKSFLAFWKDSTNGPSSAGDCSTTYSFPDGWGTNYSCAEYYTIGATGNPQITETTWLDIWSTNWSVRITGADTDSTWQLDSTVKYTLTNALTILDFALGIPTPSKSPYSRSCGVSFTGPLLTSRQASWTGDYTTFEGEVIDMTGAVEFFGEEDIDYEISWTEVDASGNTTSKTKVVTGTGDTITETFFSPGPPNAIGTIEASNVNVTELGPTPCGTCNQSASNSSPGGPGPNLSSARFDLGLGSAGHRRTAGTLRFHQTRPLSDMGTPHRLSYIGTTNSVVIVTNGSGDLRQALAPQCLADIVTTSSNRYEVRFYAITNVGSITGGVYQVTGSPYVTWTAETLGTNWHQLQLLEVRAGTTNTNTFVWSQTDQSWTLTSGNGLKSESKREVWNSGQTQLTEIWTISDPSTTNIVSIRSNLFTVYPFGRVKTEERVGGVANQQITTYSYYTNAAEDGAAYAKLKQTTHPGGSWTINTYDSEGRIDKVYSSFGNQAATTDSSLCRVTEYSYSPVGTGDGGTVQPLKPRTTIEKLLDTEVGRSYAVYKTNETSLIRCQTASAAWDASDNLVTTTCTYTNAGFKGRTKSVKRPDGTMSIYEYEVDGSGNLSTVIWSGQPNSGGTAVTNGTKLVTLQGPLGNVIERTTVDIASEIITGSEEFSDFDEFGRPGRVTYLDSTFKLYSYLCCGLESETDRDGVTTTYGYDALKRRITSTRNGIAHITTLDAANRVLFTQRQGTNASTITLASMVYDTAGRLLYQTNAVGNLTSFGESTDTNGQTLKFTTNALGATRIETYFKDGSVKSVSGTAVHGVRYDYGIESDLPYTKEIKLLTNGTDSAEWTKTFTDIAGRSFKTVYPDDAYTQSYYNNAGQLWKQRDADGVVTLYAYNGEGQVEYTALDMDRDDTIDYDGTDRITRTVRDVVAAHSTNVRRTRSYVWTTNSSTNSLLTSTVEAAVDGTRTWQTAFGLTSQSVSLCGGTCAATNIAPDGSYTTSVKTNGYLMAVTRYDSGNNQLGATTYTYDEHGRQKTISDARNGTTTLIYDDADRVTSVTTPVPASGQSSQTTTSYYDDLGRVWKTVQPDGAAVTNEFHLTGELKKTYGARTYPVEYTYDYAGRMQTLKTWQDFAGNTGTATTTWNYSTNRGFLLLKQYQDGNGPSYTYSAAGRLTSRTWARGVVTTNTYDNAGQLATIDYSDSTPDVEFTYDRQGRQITSAAGGLTTTRTFNDAGQLLSESYSGGVLDGLAVTNSYDGYLRRTNLSSYNASTLLSASLYGYDNASRLSTVSDGTNNATYGYLANSALVDSIVFKQSSTTRMTRTNRYDYINRLTSITHAAGGSNVSAFNYAYNDANQRVAVTNVDSSRWSWGYDALGQVTSGKKYWSDSTIVAGQQFEYGFDDIGNRKQTAAGGNQFGTSLRTNTYAANLLNQYTNRTVGGYVEVLGSANSNATVTVNNESTYRKGEYFRKELTVNNSSAAIWQGITNIAVLNYAGTNGEDIVTTKTGNVLVPKTPETFTYDADGNMTSDGKFTYTWDAENRMLTAESLTSAPSASRVRTEWGYLPDGRWSQRITATWNGSAYTAQATNRFVWDSQVLLAVLNGSSQTEQSYLRGSDLSGSMAEAGGVGGLLAVCAGASGVHFATFDGNGNVSSLLAADSSGLSAAYEYGPFGETLRATGPMALVNSLRFSSQFTEDLLGHLKYLHRDYLAEIGRWVNRDPLAELGGKNIYCLLSNEPLNSVDKDGRIIVTVVGAKVVNKCGGYSVEFKFALQNANQEGYLIQEVDVNETYKDCSGKVTNDKDHYWEAWTLQASPQAATLSVTDTSGRSETPGTDGNGKYKGTIRFFPKSVTGALGLQNGGWKQGNQGGGNAGNLLKTTTPPTWWNLPQVEPAASREVTIDWKCCCPWDYNNVTTNP